MMAGRSSVLTLRAINKRELGYTTPRFLVTCGSCYIFFPFAARATSGTTSSSFKPVCAHWLTQA